MSTPRKRNWDLERGKIYITPFMWLCIVLFSGLTTVFCIVLTCVSKKSQYKTILLSTEPLISENLLVTPIKQSVFWSYLIGVMLDFLVMI